MPKTEVPNIEGVVTADVLEYLDALKRSGKINMFGASEYVAREFYLTIKNARTLHSYWMKTYSERHEDEN